MKPITAESLTEAQCRELRESLPNGHHLVQWTIDACSDLDRIYHRNRWMNARREVAAAINARAKEG